jgi:hypothetical protein
VSTLCQQMFRGSPSDHGAAVECMTGPRHKDGHIAAPPVCAINFRQDQAHHTEQIGAAKHKTSVPAASL